MSHGMKSHMISIWINFAKLDKKYVYIMREYDVNMVCNI